MCNFPIELDLQITRACAPSCAHTVNDHGWKFERQATTKAQWFCELRIRALLRQAGSIAVMGGSWFTCLIVGSFEHCKNRKDACCDWLTDCFSLREWKKKLGASFFFFYFFYLACAWIQHRPTWRLTYSHEKFSPIFPSIQRFSPKEKKEFFSRKIAEFLARAVIDECKMDYWLPPCVCSSSSFWVWPERVSRWIANIRQQLLDIQSPHRGAKPGRFETFYHPPSYELGSEQGEQASERVSTANGWASGPVLTSRLLAVLTHCALFRPSCLVGGRGRGKGELLRVFTLVCLLVLFDVVSLISWKAVI